jgi:hypothetical protein
MLPPRPAPAEALHNVIDDTEDLTTGSAQTSDDETPARLDLARIQRLARLRRATHRQRSWRLIAAAVCAVAAIELCRLIHTAAARAEWSAAALWLCIAAAAAAAYFTRRAWRMPQNPPPQPSPPDAIDFAPLSNGQQFAENLAALQPPQPTDET